MREITEQTALNRVAAYCSASEHCSAEISEKLQRWGLPDETAERILNYLKAENFINENRFCKAFIRDKYRFAKWGKVKIGQALRLKNISSAVYRPLLNEIDEDEYLEILSALLASKRKSIHAKNEYELNGKLIRFALGRGFEMKDIRHCIDLSGENECSD